MQRAQNRQSMLSSDFKVEQFTAQLRALKLRATFPRAVAIAALMAAREDEELTPQDLYLRIENTYGNVIPLVACYRILGDFEKAGLVQHRYQVRDGRASVVYRRAAAGPGQDSPCFCCTNCLHKAPLADKAVQAGLIKAARQAGFRADATLVIHGICEKCHFPAPRR